MIKWSYSQNKMMLVTFICLVITSVQLLGQSCIDLTGKWQNQEGSILSITHTTDNHFSGHYQSNASGDVRLFELFGTANRQGKMLTLAWTVSWGEYGSITTWVGHCQEVDGIPTLKTMWHLVRPYVDDDWERFVTNSSTFTPFQK